MPRLKVYRTAIGFHDAYVAAPSQKAALAAWGSDANLFARGVAEVVTDPALTKAPLARPGEVIRLSRGSLTEQLRALGAPAKRSLRTRPKAASEPASPPRPPRRTKKRRRPPSRVAVERAEQALAANEAEAARELEDFRLRERKLADERKRLAARQYDRATRLEARLEAARERYRAAFAKWTESNNE
jgi:hypothetical protein